MSDNDDNAVEVVDSDDEVDEEALPSREECELRCQKFAEVTGTDSALAMFYLQDRAWELERAINDFFRDSPGNDAQSCKTEIIHKPKSASPSTKATVSEKSELSSGTSDPVKDQATYLTMEPPVLQPRHEGAIRLLSWNIDGLDPDNLQSRTEGACSVILQENPDIVFLQEVVQRSLVIIRSRCVNYSVCVGEEDHRITPNSYFTVMLLRKDCVVMESVNIADYPSSMMERNLLEVKAKVKNINLTLLTSHLESTAEYSVERKKQLRMAFARMVACSQDRTILFGGDLNLRDKELTGDSAKPHKVYDVWECTGKRQEAKFTWDLLRNDNKQLPSKFQPRCRFDRIYIRHSLPVCLTPVYFELVGIQRLASCRRYPSDHWGILAHFSLDQKDSS